MKNLTNKMIQRFNFKTLLTTKSQSKYLLLQVINLKGLISIKRQQAFKRKNHILIKIQT